MKHKDPFSRRSSSGSSEQLSYRVRQKASINYSIITSCSREWFVLNWLNSSLPTWFLTEDSFQPSWDYISAPGCVFTTKSDDVKNYFIVRFPLGAFSDHQALQKLPGVTCQIQKTKKSAVEYVARWRDGQIADSSLSVSSLLMHFQPCVCHARREGQTKSLWNQKSGSCKYKCHRNYFEIVTLRFKSLVI